MFAAERILLTFWPASLTVANERDDGVESLGAGLATSSAFITKRRIMNLSIYV